MLFNILNIIISITKKNIDNDERYSKCMIVISGFLQIIFRSYSWVFVCIKNTFIDPTI